MKNLFSVLFVFYSSLSFAQNINWQQAHGWRIYDLRGKKGMHIVVDSLQQFKSITLDDDSVRYFLTGATEIHRGDEPVWMGAIILSCIDSSEVFRKIDVSVYGGFFYDEQTKKYFLISDQIKGEWMEYLTRKGQEMQR